MLAAFSAMSPDTPPERNAPDVMMDDILARYAGRKAAGDASAGVADKILPAGFRLRHYVIERALGSGGFGVTYLAREDFLDREVVIKENFPASVCCRRASDLHVVSCTEEDAASCGGILENFQREARLLGDLNHPSIVRVYSFFTALGTAYYVMEYIEGRSLDKVAGDSRRAGWPISQDDLYGLMVRVLDALDYLHGRSLLHGDVKPDNVLVRRNGLPVLIDFGAVCEMSVESAKNVVESAGFSPPEQSLPKGRLGPWSDIYAFGATLFYILAGELLPAGSRRLLYDAVRPLARRGELLRLYHPRLLMSIDKAISPRVGDRYASVSEWMADLAGSSAS